MDPRFGPRQRTMLEEISHILTQYPDGSNILKELIQNADDACAGSIAFLLDPTQHSAGHLASPDLAEYQGPALYSWNDSIFTEKDWEGIQRIGKSVKERTLLKVGRFGLGFVSVYHLTDTPTILSDKLLGINHPLRELSEPNSRGVSIPIDHLATSPDLSDHLSCFKGYFGYQGGVEYKGTIFRFPLRRKSSAISAGVSDVTSVRDKLLLPLMNEAEYSMLFLKSVSSIEIREKVGNEVHKLFRAEIPLKYQNIVKQYRKEITEFVSSREYLTHTKLFICLFPIISSLGGDSEKREKVWLVINLIGFGSPNGELLRFYREHDLNYLPWVGLGLATGVRDMSRCGCWCFEWNEDDPSVLFNSIKCVFSNPFIVDPDTELDISTGRIFCFLPTQLDSKFPLHIHGYFSLSSNRRSIDWPANDNEKDIGAKWNLLMTQNLTSIAYAAFLYIAFTALNHPSPLKYHYQLLSRWSPHEPGCALFSSVLCEGLRRLSRHFLLFSHQNGGKWLDINVALFLPSLFNESLAHEDVCLKLFQLLEQPIVEVPTFVSEIILNIPEINSRIQERILTPVNIRDLLVNFSDSLPCMEYLATANTCLALLEILLSYVTTLEPNQPFLEGVPLLPIAGSSQPRLFSHNGDTVYYISDNTAIHLTIFPGLENSFVNPSIPTKLHSILLSLARGTSLNIFDLTNLENNPELFSRLLTKSLASLFIAEGAVDSVTWHPGVGNHPTDGWITQLYHFIGTTHSLFSAVSHLPILPQHSITSDVITLLPLQSQSVYVEIGTDLNLKWVELMLERSGCYLCEKQSFIECFREFVLAPIPAGLIPALCSTQILNNFIPKFQDAQITDEMKYDLIDLLVPYVDESNINIIKRLPLFPNTHGEWLTLHPDIILPPLNIPPGIVYPTHFISLLRSSVRILCERLSLPAMSTEYFFTNHLVPFLVSLGNCDARDKLTVFVLENITRLNFEVCGVGACLKDTEWVSDATADCCLHTPSRLLDPRDPILNSLLPHSKSLFPSDICQNHFDIMKRFLDMKSHDTLTCELLVEVCQYSVETLKSKTGSDWQGTFHVLLDLLANYLHSFDSLSSRGLFEVFEAPFMFPDESPPNDWPHSVRFQTSNRLCCPRDVVLCPPNDIDLIGSTSCTVSNAFYNPTAQQVLIGMGVLSLSPELVIRQLNYISQSEIKKADGEKVYRMVSKIYTYLNSNDFPLRDLESSIVFIPAECKFVSKEFIVFETPFDLTPHLYSLRQLRYESTQLFHSLAIEPSPSPERLSLILCQMEEMDSLLSDNQLRIVVDILKYFVEQDVLTTELRIYIPGKDLRLYAPRDEKLVFWDHRWLDRNLIEEDFVIVHGSISNDLAYKLGVSPFSERVAPPSEDFWCEELGQQVSVTDRLRSILEAYSGNINVLKEMLQNADDAKATELKIVFDWRNHPNQALLSNELKDWQGPAILFYNDSIFSDKDFENIMKIDGATKAEDATTIGRYGLGFCTVYHFTDVPSFVSRNYVHIFDPQKKYISKSKGGRKVDFCNGEYVKYIRLYRDQFVPYEGIFGCDILNHRTFNGTLFRVPLRSSKISSDISLIQFDDSEMTHLQETFVREAEGLLFFTQCVTSIGIYNITSQDTELIHMVVKNKICQSPATQPFIHSNKHLVKLLYEGQPVTPVVSCCPYELTVTNKQSMEWIVIYATGSEACVDVIREFPSALVAPLPFAGVAMNLDLLQQVEQSDFQSTLYSFFPLPISTSFPFHCHAMFELRHDRQGLVDTVEAKTEWNKVLVSDALVLATLALYKHLAEKVQHSNDEISLNAYIRVLYQMFSKDVLSDPLWKGFASAISKQFSESEFKLFPILTETGNDWESFGLTNFLNIPSFRTDLRELFSHSFSRTVIDVVVTCGHHVAIIPDSISESSALLSLLFEIGANNIIDLKKFTQIFFANIAKIEERIIIYVLTILISACTFHSWLRETVKSTACLPCGDTGTLLVPYKVVDPNSQLVAQLFERSENRLPSETCIDYLFTNGPVLDNLKTYLGLITSKLSAEELGARAEYISANCNRELAVRLIEYLDQKIFTGSEFEEMRSVIWNVPFIPVECPNIAETFSLILKFFSPSEIIPFCMKSVMELQFPVCPENILRYQDFISNFLGNNINNLPSPITSIAIGELKLCIEHYDILVQSMDLPDKVCKIYETIGEHCPSDGYSEVPNNGILIPSVGFCDKSRLLLDSNEDFPPYIFSLNSYYSRRSRYVNDFFVKMGVDQTLSHLQCMMVIEELHNTHRDVPLTPDMQQIVLNFLSQIYESHTERDNKFLLGKDNIIHLAQDCVFYDLNWEQRSSSAASFPKNDKIYYFINIHISNEIAFKLGARPLSDVKLSGRSSLPFAFKSRGQSESLTMRLKNILSEYESDVDIFKELTQNADDAHATEIKFLFDYSHHGVERVMQSEMKYWQGPAIYCYNNSTFSEVDFESITRLAGRSKMEDRTSIGTYRIGFNTVYHLTDLPSFVSRRLLTFFDPQVRYLSGLVHPHSPGMQIDFIDEWNSLKEFSDQFSVYNGIFGCDLSKNTEFDGTLFRLPLRTKDIDSEISLRKYNPKIFLKELHNKLTNMAKELIMFLQTINTIELYARPSLEQGMILTHRVTKSPPPTNFIISNKTDFDRLLRGTPCDPIYDVSTFRITAHSPPHPNEDPEEFIVSCASGTKLCFDLVNKIKNKYEVCTLPVCSVAVPKCMLTLSIEEFTDCKYYLFCFLPLPCLSNYRMHINGSFQLQQSRRALHCSSDGSIRTEWNQSLIADALPIAVVNMLTALTDEFPTDTILTDQQLERYYSIWPNSNQDDILWGKFSLMIAERIMKTDSRIFYCSTHPRRWIAFEEASLFITDPSIYTLGSEFTDILFHSASQDEIYFINVPFQFTKQGIMSHLNFDETNLFQIDRACREILFPKFETIMESNPGIVKLIIETLLLNLKYAPCLKELLTTEECFPCGEENPEFRAIREVVSPNSRFAQIFYFGENRLPHSLFEEINPEASLALISLGIIVSELPLHLLVDRCHKTLQLEPDIAERHAKHLLDYINTMRPTIQNENEIRTALNEIPFIPVYQDVLYNTICSELTCSYSSPSFSCMFNMRHLSPHSKAVTMETNYLRKAMSILGISANIIPLQAALDSIFLIQENISKTEKLENSHISETFKAIYLFIAECCFSGGDEDANCKTNQDLVSTRLAGKSWILSTSYRTFYPVTQTILSQEYLHFHTQFLNTFPFPPSLSKKYLKRFTEFMEIPTEISPEMAHKIICLMKERFSDNPLPSTDEACNEVGFVIQLINNVLKDLKETPADIYLLTECKELQLASSLYLNDAPWIDYSEMERAEFVHRYITLFSSEKLGAKSRIESICVPVGFEQFGQHESISNRIDTLLRELPCDVTIFKELIQNAEDAKATEVGIVLDCQYYEQQSLCLAPKYQKKWAELQRVPSLLIYNNRPFTEADIEGIQAVGMGGKQGQDTIGRFGLGFNSVFHLTRVPCLLTCSEDGSVSNFCVFDPYREHLKLPLTAPPGLRLKIDTINLGKFLHQFSPYFLEPIFVNFNDHMCNLRERKCFSIFRLPLNILSGGNNLNEAKRLVSDLIREAPRLFPFISHVKNINIFHIKPDGIVTREGILNSEIISSVERPFYKGNIRITTKKVIVSRLSVSAAENPEVETNEVNWLIYHFEGNVDTFCQGSDLLQGNVTVYNREKLKLFSSIAVETVSEDSPVPTQKRYLYCHLPFGTFLNFPVHINCPFILDPHRRYVSYQDEVTGNSSWDNIWHSEIMKRILTPLYSKLLIDLGPGGEKHSNLPDAEYFEWYYDLFPIIHETDRGSNSMEFLQALGREVLKILFQDNSRILLADDMKIRQARTWYQVHGTNSGIFKAVREENIHWDISKCAECLVKLDYQFTFAPISLANSFEACELKCTFFKPLKALEYINTNRDKLAKVLYSFPCSLENCVLTFSELSTILKLIEDKPNDCIPLKVDYDSNLGIFNTSENSSFTRKYVSLLPHLRNQFLCEEYENDAIRLLIKHGYVEKLNANFLAQNLQIPACLSPEFFLLFWTFIYENRSRNLSLFDGYKLVPVVYSQETTFLAIKSLSRVATEKINSSLKNILLKLECPFLCLPFDMDNLPFGRDNFDSIKTLLESLAVSDCDAMSIIKCVSLCTNIDLILSGEEACILRGLFEDINFSFFEYWKTLLCLKIFVAHSGPTETTLVALSGFRIFLNRSDFPLQEDLIHRLYESFNIIFLSNTHTPVKLIYGLKDEHSGVHLVDVKELVCSYILSTVIFPQLEPSLQIFLIELFNSLIPPIDWMNSLINLQFIKTEHGLFKPSELYCPQVKLFVIHRKERLLPECWEEQDEIYQIIKNLGLIMEMPLDIILESAKDVATSSSPESKLTKLTIKALKNYVNTQYKGNATEDTILRQLANIPFLRLFDVRTLISTNQESQRVFRFGCFSDAQLYTHHDYCCTVCSIFGQIVSFDNEKVMELLGLKANPPILSVKAHLDNLMDTCRQLSAAEDGTYLEQYFLKTYEYLQDSPDALPEFQNADCIFYGSKLYRPINIVMDWKSDLSPYLFQCPLVLNPYKAFLFKVGVSERPNYRHFKSVLIDIHRVNNSHCVLAIEAFNFLIEELRALQSGEIVELDGMLLLTNKLKLIMCNSSDFFYADDTQLLNRVSALFPDIRILASLNCDEIGSSAPPSSLKLKYLSNAFTQTLCPNVYNNRITSEQAELFQTRLQSSEVYTALKRIYFHQTSKDLNKLKFRGGTICLDTGEDQHPVDEGYSTFRDKIERLRIIAVSRIDVVISDARAPADSCVSFLDKTQDKILINTDSSLKERIPVEMTNELNQYFCNLFERSLFHLLICLVYPREQIGLALNNVNVKQLPPDLDQDNIL